jgi:hypothetical protein
MRTLVASKIGREFGSVFLVWARFLRPYSNLAQVAIMILVASVHHTGTKLVYDYILDEVEDKKRVHIEPDNLDELRKLRQMADIIVPLRHPRRVAQGWKYRSKRLEDLGTQWHMLKTDIAPFTPYYLPIEHEERDRWLSFIGKALGLELKTEWPIIGTSKGISIPELEDREEAFVSNWMKDGFFEQFGYT